MTKIDQANLTKLENANIRSDDMYTGDAVNEYLRGDMSRSELKTELTNRRKEMQQSINGIDKLLLILPNCPKQVSFD